MLDRPGGWADIDRKNPRMKAILTPTFALVLSLLPVAAQEQAEGRSLPPTKISPAIEAAVETHADLVFARNGERAMLLNLYRPKGAKRALPAIVCIHGGGWHKGDRRHHAHIAKALAARGYVTVSIDYRLSDEAIFPAHIHDCKAAVRWLRANSRKWGINPRSIGATGSSAGGHLAALLATSGGVKELEGQGGNAGLSSRIQAAAPMGAQSDFLSERNRKKSAEAGIWQKFLGGTQEEVPETYQLASPRHHLDGDDPPIFFLSGEFDDPSTHAVEFREDCRAFGVPSKHLVIPGAPHGFLTKQKFFDSAVGQLDTFFAQHLKRKNAPRSAPTRPKKGSFPDKQ
jgi:pectinesterase